MAPSSRHATSASPACCKSEAARQAMDHRALTGAITSVLGNGGAAVRRVVGRVVRASLGVDSSMQMPDSARQLTAKTGAQSRVSDDSSVPRAKRLLRIRPLKRTLRWKARRQGVLLMARVKSFRSRARRRGHGGSSASYCERDTLAVSCYVSRYIGVTSGTPTEREGHAAAARAAHGRLAFRRPALYGVQIATGAIYIAGRYCLANEGVSRHATLGVSP